MKGPLIVKISDKHYRFRYMNGDTITRERNVHKKDEETVYLEEKKSRENSAKVFISKDHIVFRASHIPNQVTDGWVAMDAECPFVFRLNVLCLAILAISVVCLLLLFHFSFPYFGRGTIFYSEYHPFALRWCGSYTICLTKAGEFDYIAARPYKDQLADLESFHVTYGGVVYHKNYLIMTWSPLRVDCVKKIRPDKTITKLESPNKTCYAKFDPKQCALTFHDKRNPKAVLTWFLADHECDHLVMQKDNNLVAYDKNYKAVWASDTENHSGSLTPIVRCGMFGLVNEKGEWVKKLFSQ